MKHVRISQQSSLSDAYGTRLPPEMRTIGTVNMDATRKIVHRVEIVKMMPHNRWKKVMYLVIGLNKQKRSLTAV